MFIFKDTLKRCNPYQPYKDAQGTQYTKVPAELYEEIPDPVRGDDAFNYNQEIEDAPYLIVTPKSQEQIDAVLAERARVAADAESLDYAKAAPVIKYLATHTPAECEDYVQTNVTDLASAKTMMKHFAVALCVIARREFRE